MTRIRGTRRHIRGPAESNNYVVIVASFSPRDAGREQTVGSNNNGSGWLRSVPRPAVYSSVSSMLSLFNVPDMIYSFPFLMYDKPQSSSGDGLFTTPTNPFKNNKISALWATNRLQSQNGLRGFHELLGGGAGNGGDGSGGRWQWWFSLHGSSKRMPCLSSKRRHVL